MANGLGKCNVKFARRCGAVRSQVIPNIHFLVGWKAFEGPRVSEFDGTAPQAAYSACLPLAPNPTVGGPLETWGTRQLLLGRKGD